MSLSVARPILIEPGGASTDRPGRRIFSMLVAMLDVSLDRGAAVGPIEVTGSIDGCEIGCATTAGRGGSGAPVGYRGSGPDGYIGCGRDVLGGVSGRDVCGGWAGQAVLDRCATGTDAVCGGRPADPV